MTTPDLVDETDEKPEPEAKGLRAQNDSLRKEVRELKADKRDVTVAGLGLQTDTGLGLVLVEQFDKGDIALDEIASTATKYGHVVPEVAPQNPTAQRIAASHEALGNVEGASGSLAPPTEADALAKAESDKDFNTTIAMKGQQINEMLRPTK